MSSLRLKTMDFSSVSSPDEIKKGQMYTGIRLQVNDVGLPPTIWDDVRGAFVERDAPGYYGTVRAIFLDRTFPTGQVVQVGLNTGRIRSILVDIKGKWHPVTRLAS